MHSLRDSCSDFLELLSESSWSCLSNISRPDTIEHSECFDLISNGVWAGGLSERYPGMNILNEIDKRKQCSEITKIVSVYTFSNIFFEDIKIELGCLDYIYFSNYV